MYVFLIINSKEIRNYYSGVLVKCFVQVLILCASFSSEAFRAIVLVEHFVQEFQQSNLFDSSSEIFCACVLVKYFVRVFWWNTLCEILVKCILRVF
jgi:hypothetical protein